ncbi:hypothetical protein [Pseudomonas fluorescens]|uniref:hypothetical protein n=1 Tax=Pseudomonas fluorescens TaxID=294 RepID=UPI001240830D|nr:hypothetical protein [Pseudomonas fluorescens]VVN43860.1 hypothetical protein PS639_05565 [Pseudomonas fluorescens]
MEKILDQIIPIFGEGGLLIAAIAIIIFFTVTSIFKIFDTYRQTFSTKHALEEKKLIEEIRKLQAERAILVKTNQLETTFFNPNDSRDLEIDKRPIHEKISVSLISYGELGKLLLQGIITALITIGGMVSIFTIIFFIKLIFDKIHAPLAFITLFITLGLGGAIVYYGTYILGQHLMKVSIPRYVLCWVFVLAIIITMLWNYIDIILPNIPEGPIA